MRGRCSRLAAASQWQVQPAQLWDVAGRHGADQAGWRSARDSDRSCPQGLGRCRILLQGAPLALHMCTSLPSTWTCSQALPCLRLGSGASKPQQQLWTSMHNSAHQAAGPLLGMTLSGCMSRTRGVWTRRRTRMSPTLTCCLRARRQICAVMTDLSVSKRTSGGSMLPQRVCCNCCW